MNRIDKVRLNIALDKKTFEEALEPYKGRHGTYTQVIKTGLAYHNFFQKKLAEGQKVYIEDKNGDLREVLFFDI